MHPFCCHGSEATDWVVQPPGTFERHMFYEFVFRQRDTHRERFSVPIKAEYQCKSRPPNEAKGGSSSQKQKTSKGSKGAKRPAKKDGTGTHKFGTYDSKATTTIQGILVSNVNLSAGNPCPPVVPRLASPPLLCSPHAFFHDRAPAII